MYLNAIKPNESSFKNRRRVGRGIGSGLGKTCGRGHKGQKSRTGGFHKIGFEGGQMPIQRRLPKRGFVSTNTDKCYSLRLSDLQKLNDSEIDMQILKRIGLIPANTRKVKIYNSGVLSRKIIITNIKVSIGVKGLIEQVGGSVL